MQEIVTEIRLVMGVDQVVFKADLVRKIDRILGNLLSMSLVIGIGIFITAIITVSNTIRLIIHSKLEQIRTMRLLGATDGFIKFPFLLEGIWQGFLGALLSVLTLWILYELLWYLQEQLPVYIVRPEYLLIGNLAMGIFLGFVGSYRSVSKYIE